MSHFAQLPRHVTPDAVPDFSPTHERFNVVWRDGQVCNLPPTVGPNGGPVGYNSSGDKVEYLFNDDMEDSLFLEENILRRNDRAILEAYDELWYRVWGLRRECLGGAPAPSREPPPSRWPPRSSRVGARHAVGRGQRYVTPVNPARKSPTPLRFGAPFRRRLHAHPRLRLEESF